MASLGERLKERHRLAPLYQARPWAFAIGEGELPPVLGPEVMRKAAGDRAVLSFSSHQKGFLRDFADPAEPRVIAKTGRGGSKTFCAAVGIADLAWALPTLTATVNAGSLDQAEMLYDYWATFCESPAMRVPVGPVVGEPRKRETKLRNGGWIKIRAASEKQAKSRHPMLVVLDEACATDPDIMLLVEGQLVGAPHPYGPAPLYRVMSTPDKPFHLFRDRWEDREAQGYRGHEWGAKDCPWITKGEIAQMRLDHDKNWCRIHLEGEFGSATGTVFDYDDVQAASVPTLQDDPAWGPFDEDPGLVEASAVGVDWGHVHPTVIVVVVAARVGGELRYWVVHVEGHERKASKFLYERIARASSAWGANAFLDSNDARANSEVRVILGEEGRTARPVAFSKWNDAMIGGVRSLLEHRLLRIPLVGEGHLLLRQLADYEWDPDAARRGVEKPRKVADDYVDALKLAVWGLREGGDEPPGILRVRR
ncbi:MAG: hypothetical protein V3U45_03715 [bacterium]